ncbi:MAG: UDP-N-acetylmuramate dehydrogenase [Candidatus Kapabacteria bacterium]|nr:UDP-N-acetylmuramate dehydrogenase [Candidatus Kapabacteria bacterium]
MEALRESVDLAEFTTMHCHAVASNVVDVRSVEELVEALAWAGERSLHVRVLGGGSNVVPTSDVNGLVIVMRIQERSPCVDGDVVHVRLGAGEVWHDVVEWTVSQGWGGMENMALIPGTVGAAPMQNIGAYGVEQASIFEELECYDRQERRIVKLNAEECRFGYRESIFKHEYCERMIITSVAYRLSTSPKINASYRDVSQELTAMGVAEPTIADVMNAVVSVRRRKLPDPAEIGNSGSFFKNPVVEAATAERIRADHPDAPAYPQADGRVKLAAAWLIDQCGWKGARSGDAGVHDRQALVLVNHGTASGSDILALASAIQQSVHQRFGIMLEREVNVW